MASWDLPVDISCLLCETGINDLNHIFVDCPYVQQVRG
ncbi:hypothetical protein LINGRAHAP2_LOCUS17907 [Linum grandiflorum]